MSLRVCRSPASEILSEIHAAVQRRHLAVAVEHQRRPLLREETVLTDAPLAGLRPSRMIDLRVDVRIEAVFVGSCQIPGGRRLFLDEANLDDGFGRFKT